LQISLTSFGVHLRPAEDARTFGQLSRKIEEWGFDSIWLADGLTRDMPEPFALLACAAFFTTRVKLGTCVYVVPVRHPLETAKLTTTVDRLSNGRLIFGVGVGWKEDEFRATGISFDKRGKVTDECLTVLNQAWTKGAVDFVGDYFKISGIRMEYRPVQKPHPQVWVGGNGWAAALRAARFGDCWIPTDYTVQEYKKAHALLARACSQVNRSATEVRIASHLMLIMDKSRSVAEDLAGKVAVSLHENVGNLKKWAIVGDPNEVKRRLSEYNEVGVDYHVLNFAGKVRDEERIELFARDVLPAYD